MKNTLSREKVNFKLIEAELYNYKSTKKELEDMKEDIINSSAYSEVAVQSSPGNSTQSKAIQLMSSAVLREMERRISAIDNTISILERCPEPRKLRLMQMKYFESRFTDTGIWQELNIERATFYRWRREVISLIADKLGYVV